jgi:hypothetical protein
MLVRDSGGLEWCLLGRMLREVKLKKVVGSEYLKHRRNEGTSMVRLTQAAIPVTQWNGVL